MAARTKPRNRRGNCEVYYAVLDHLFFFGPATQSEIAAATGHKIGSIHVVLYRLCRTQFAERVGVRHRTGRRGRPENVWRIPEDHGEC